MRKDRLSREMCIAKNNVIKISSGYTGVYGLRELFVCMLVSSSDAILPGVAGS